MKLTEYEGKELLNKAGLLTPEGVVVTTDTNSADIQTKIENLSQTRSFFVKAQVLMGNRALNNLVIQATTPALATEQVQKLLGSTAPNGESINAVAIEAAIDINNTYYLSLSYDTSARRLIAAVSNQAGVGMDDRGETVQIQELSIQQAPSGCIAYPELNEVLVAAWQVFVDNDATLVEINPLAKTDSGWVCLDAKIELEDKAAFRHADWQNYSQRSEMNRPPTPKELAAHEVSRSDHRGAAGESFFEFPGGNIGVLAAGGGASVLAMDALLAEGMQPANYTEHSGNPPREKVKKLADIILSIPNLHGLFVVGTNANFTDIYETLSGVVDSLEKSKYGAGFAVLIRRGGPRWQEAFAAIKPRLASKGFTFKLLGPDFPISATAAEMKKLLTMAQEK